MHVTGFNKTMLIEHLNEKEQTKPSGSLEGWVGYFLFPVCIFSTVFMHLFLFLFPLVHDRREIGVVCLFPVSDLIFIALPKCQPV